VAHSTSVRSNCSSLTVPSLVGKYVCAGSSTAFAAELNIVRQKISAQCFEPPSMAILAEQRSVCIQNPDHTTLQPHRRPALTKMGNHDSLTIDNDPGGVIVVHGDIDVAGGPILDAAILERETKGPVVIDLVDVFFIDSSGLRSLLGASRRARERGATVVLRGVGSEVLRLLEITGTTEHFSIETSRE
jgi:anti-sigma B factor antagonist